MKTKTSILTVLDDEWRFCPDRLDSAKLQTVLRPDFFGPDDIGAIVTTLKSKGPFRLETAQWQQLFTMQILDDASALWDAYFANNHEYAAIWFDDVRVGVWCPDEHSYHVYFGAKDAIDGLRATILRDNEQDVQEYVSAGFNSDAGRVELSKAFELYGV